MANTGVTVADAVIDEFNDVKLGRKEAKFITYKIEDGLIVTETIGTSTDFEEFVNLLPENDCRYAVYDCEFVTTDGRDGKKLVLISW
jgi:cofilin